MILTYRNQRGSLQIGGQSPFCASEVRGLGLVKKRFKTIQYIDGAKETIAETSEPRTVEVSGTVTSQALSCELSRASKLLSIPGTLYVYGKSGKRKIFCRADAFDVSIKDESRAGFTISFTAYDPMFKDLDKTQAAIYTKSRLLSGTFTLPAMLSQRNSRAGVVVLGDTKTEPKIIITTVHAGGAGGDETGFEIINHTTQQRIRIHRAAQTGEVITVDIPNRKIISSLEGDITGAALDPSCRLGSFYLDCGTNDIEVINHNTGAQVGVVCQFSNQYAEAFV